MPLHPKQKIYLLETFVKDDQPGQASLYTYVYAVAAILLLFIAMYNVIFCRFPSHTISVEAKRSEKQRVIEDLREKLANKELEGRRVYFVTLPMESVHSHRLIGATRHMNPDIRIKINEFVADNITNARIIKRLLRKHVQQHYSSDPVKPHITDRSYYPLERDITNCVHSFISAGKYSHLDQLNLEKMVTDWIASDTSKPVEERTKVYYRKSSTESEGGVLSSVDVAIGTITDLACVSNEGFTGDIDTDSDDDEEEESDHHISNSTSGTTFLFVYQEPWQQKLLLRYGNMLTLMDATYKTTKYALPLFLICVRSNCGYMPVAHFIVEQETAFHISEALKIVSCWNSGWLPPYFMIDYSDAELNAIVTVFPKA